MEIVDQFAAPSAGSGRISPDRTTDDAIYVLDVSGILISANCGARQLTGYDEDEALGKHFSIFYSDEDQNSGVPQPID